MPEPTYRIAQRLHERRAAVGLPKYGRHLDADSQGCMLVHALEEAADQVNYLIAEAQRRRESLILLIEVAKYLKDEGQYGYGDTITTVIDLLGGDDALARYDEILGTVAEKATVAALPKDADAEAALAAVSRDEAEAAIERLHGPKADPRDEALLVAEEKTWKVVMFLDGVHRHKLIENYSPDYSGLQDARVDAATALAAIRGAR